MNSDLRSAFENGIFDEEKQRLSLSNGAPTNRRGGRSIADFSITVNNEKELVEVMKGANRGMKQGCEKVLQRLLSLVGMGRQNKSLRWM